MADVLCEARYMARLQAEALKAEEEQKRKEAEHLPDNDREVSKEGDEDFSENNHLENSGED